MAGLAQANGPDSAAPSTIGERQTTVLFADIGLAQGGRPADKPKELSQCLEVLGKAAEISGGRVLNSRDTEVLALFATPDAAAAAAARMQVYAETIPGRFAVRAAFHAGPVSQRGKDIFGDTVNLALKLVDEAKQGQIVTSQATAENLSPSMQDAVRPLRSISLEGADKPLIVGEFVWRQESLARLTPGGAKVRVKLQLAYKKMKLLRRRESELLSIGRDPDCDLTVLDAHASRRHCTIERRKDGFFLRDHSTNGTFVAPHGRAEIRLRETELKLEDGGWITLGQSREKTEEVVQYRCLPD